jgi:hypothetical protein
VRDSGFNSHAVFLIAATGIAEELVDRADVWSLFRFDGIEAGL